MNYRRCAILTAIIGFIISLQVFGFQEAAKEEAPFQWLDATRQTAGLKFTTQRVRPITLQTETGPPVEVETEEKQIDANTKRISRRAYSVSANGAKRLSETTVEEIKKMPDGRIQAVRTVSRPDLNGRLSTVRRETQEMIPTGADAYRITRTLMLPSIENVLEQQEQITQTETRKGDTQVEIDRVRYLPGINGAWNVAERRVSRNRVEKDRSRTEEQVYRYDLDNQMQLSRQIRVTEATDSAGRIRQQVEMHEADLEGTMRLSEMLTIVQTPLRDGKQEKTQTLEMPGPATPGEGLRLVRRVVEQVEEVGPSQRERQIEVQEADLDGRMRRVESWLTTEIE